MTEATDEIVELAEADSGVTETAEVTEAPTTETGEEFKVDANA
jgi:hypothetical protein